MVDVVTLAGSFAIGMCSFEPAFESLESMPWRLVVSDRWASNASADGSRVDSQSLTWENHFILLPRRCDFMTRVSVAFPRSLWLLTEVSYPDLKEFEFCSHCEGRVDSGGVSGDEENMMEDLRDRSRGLCPENVKELGLWSVVLATPPSGEANPQVDAGRPSFCLSGVCISRAASSDRFLLWPRVNLLSLE